MLEKLTAADFQDLVDRQFQITYADYQEALTLKSVEAKRKSPVPGRFRSV